MDKLRLRQAQILIKEAGESKSKCEKLKSAKEGVINADLLTEIMNELIETEKYIYSSKPSHKLNRKESEGFCNKIIDIRNKLDEILSDFGVIEKESPVEKIKKLSENFLILTTKNNFKKSFSKMGVDPQRIIVAGVPLHVEDMKVLNPKIPENALEGISKKIEHVKNDIERKVSAFNLEKIYVIVEEDKAGEILANRAEKLYDAETIAVDKIKDLTPDEFIKAVA